MISRIKGLIANSMQLGSSTTSPAMAGDVAYWDGSKVKTTPMTSYTPELGTPVGVVVVPTGFAPDGRARIISLKPVDKNGNHSNSHVYMVWGPYGTDTSLTNFTVLPVTFNTDSTSIGSSSNGFLPADKFTGATSFVDNKAKYTDGYPDMIPSPYLGDDPNPEYYKTISGNNVLGDFNGLSNTQTLVGLGTRYTAANAAWKYKDGASNLQWYLPGMAELGYIMPRFNVINNTLTALGGLAVDSSGNFWSSSEESSTYAYSLRVYDGYVSRYIRDDYDFYVRPFAILEDGEDSINLITFTVNGTEYQAEKGMTWSEFVDSEYNTNKYSEISGYFVNYRGAHISINSYNVLTTDLIIENGAYTVDGGSND